MTSRSDSGTRHALATFYFLFFSLVGCILPFWGLYLQHRGFEAEEIGALLAGFSMIRIVAPNLWAHYVRLRRRQTDGDVMTSDNIK